MLDKLLSIDESNADVRELLIGTVRAALDLVTTEETRRKWDDPSVLPHMTVGSIVVHLFGATCGVTATFLDAEPPPGQRALAAHRLIAGVPTDLDAEVHERVWSEAADEASKGPEDAAAWATSEVEGLEYRLRREPADRRVRVMAGIDMQLDDFVLTRLVEGAIHLDDLAVSLGVATPLPDGAAAAVVDCLVRVARQRHGDLDVMRALARHDRAPALTLRVF